MSIVTYEQLKAAPWQDAVKDAHDDAADYRWSAFNKLIGDLDDDNEHLPALRLIGNICSTMLRSHREHGEALAPSMIFEGRRSFAPEDLTMEQGEELFKFLDEVDDLELKARIADTLWVSKQVKQKHLAAKAAIEAYLASGESLIRSDNHGGEKRLSRAIDIAKELGRGGAEDFSRGIELIEKLALAEDGVPENKQCELMAILLHNRSGDAKKCGIRCELLAKAEAENQYFHGERRLWSLAARWHTKADDTEAERRAKLLEAETYVYEADHAGSAFAETHALQQGIEAFRRVGGEDKRIKELHHRLIESEKRIEQEMHPISTPVDIEEIAQEVVARVEGKGLVEALIEFARITAPPSPDELKAQAQKIAEETPLSSLMGGTLVNSQGKTLAKTPAAFSGDTADAEEALSHKMHNGFQFDASLNVEGVIIPALQQILREHHITLKLMLELVQHNQFVPEGREMIFARGLKAGFEGDFLTSTHFLVPQIENSMRSLVERQGGITSGLTSEGIQREHGLDILLGDKHIKNLFDDNHLFAFETLLIKQTGFNLRHDMAHGLIDHDSFHSIPAVYFWWLVFRICMVPVIIAHHQAHEDTDQPSKDVEKEAETR